MTICAHERWMGCAYDERSLPCRTLQGRKCKMLRPGTGALCVMCMRAGSHVGDFGCLRSLLTLNDLELYSIALSKRLEAGSLDCAEVDEDIRTTHTRDEAVAFRVVEPRHGAG